MKKVSVCVVAYNQENYIRECLDSIVNQETTVDYEIIVVDDGSTDGTRSIINEFANKYDVIRPVYNKENLGVYQTFVKAHNLATGEYVCHCDGDDRWLADKLAKQVCFLDNNLDYSVVWCRMNLFNDFGGFLSGESFKYSDIFPDSIITLDDALKFGSVAAHSSIMYRRKFRITKEIKEFPLIDYYYTLEFLSSGKGKILKDVLAEYRVNAHSAITTTNGQDLMLCNLLYLGKYLKLDKKYKKPIFINACFNLVRHFKNRRYKLAIGYLKLAACSFNLATFWLLPKHFPQAIKLKTPKLDS